MKMILIVSGQCECGQDLDTVYLEAGKWSTALKCANRDCVHYGKLFEHPAIELKEITVTS